MRKARNHERLVWQQTSRGWTKVRATVPRAHARSERVPRPPEHRSVVGAEDAPRSGDDLVQLAELYIAGQLAAELVRRLDVPKRIGVVPTALLAWWLLSKGKRK
jgi:hypothetical protein